MDLTCEERLSDSPFVERVWRSRSESEGSFLSMADSHWGMVISKYRGKTSLTIRGPETRATPAFCPADMEFVGIQFKSGTLMPDLPAKMLMDRCDVTLPEANNHTFWLKGAAWQFPDFENMETFVNRLMHDGLLLTDPVVGAILQGRPVKSSLRTVQRRFLQATGLTNNTVFQIERARQALTLLTQGLSILDTIDQMGYFDQPHLTRSLKHFVGLTPAQIINSERSQRLSFLYKTSPPY